MSTSRIAELPSDAGVLRALVLEMQRKLDLGDARLAQHVRRLEQRDERIAQLEEMVRLLRHHRFGAKSERASGEQPELFNEAEATLDAAEAAGEATSEDDPAEDATRAAAHPRATRARGSA